MHWILLLNIGYFPDEGEFFVAIIVAGCYYFTWLEKHTFQKNTKMREDVVSKIKVLTPKMTVITMVNRELDFHYRTSFLKKHKGYICLEATIVLKKGNKEEKMFSVRNFIEQAKDLKFYKA